MKKNDALELIFSRNSFYRRQYLLALAAFGLAIVVIGFLISVLLYLVRNPTHPLFFATDEVGHLIPITPVNVPNMSNADVIKWTIEAVQNTYSYDYVNYRDQLQDAQKYFTNYGWQKYLSALQLSNNLVALSNRKQVVLAQVVDQPKIVAQGILAGSFAWKFEMPVLVVYWEPPYDEKSKFYNPLQVSVIVQRQQILQSYKGLGIVQLIAAIAASNQPQELSNTPTS